MPHTCSAAGCIGWRSSIVEQGRFEAAERLNQEALEIADAHDERDIQIRASVLSQRLQVILGRVSTDEAIERLLVLEGVWTEPHARALLLDAQWHLDPTVETVRIAAADLYRALYERTPDIEYRAAHAIPDRRDTPASAAAASASGTARGGDRGPR